MCMCMYCMGKAVVMWWSRWRTLYTSAAEVGGGQHYCLGQLMQHRGFCPLMIFPSWQLLAPSDGSHGCEKTVQQTKMLTYCILVCSILKCAVLLTSTNRSKELEEGPSTAGTGDKLVSSSLSRSSILTGSSWRMALITLVFNEWVCASRE